MRRRFDTIEPGARAPDYTLPDTEGDAHSLRDLIASGPLLLIFDRGTW
jgi:peroxiredoxin